MRCLPCALGESLGAGQGALHAAAPTVPSNICPPTLPPMHVPHHMLLSSVVGRPNFVRGSFVCRYCGHHGGCAPHGCVRPMVAMVVLLLVGLLLSRMLWFCV
jgi:hypothetical protein